PVDGVHHRGGVVIAATGGTRIHRGEAQPSYLEAGAAVRAGPGDVHDQFFVVATAPAHLDAAARVDGLAGDVDTGHRGRNHQPRVVAVQQPGDVNCRVQQRNCRGLG